MYNISDALYSLGARNFVLLGEPTNQEEFEQMFKVVVADQTPELPILADGIVSYDIAWEAVLAELSRLEEEYQLKEYQRQRQSEYPPLADLADAMYWQAQGDDSKMTAYLAAVQAVKDKYPKGNE
jgi:hypothetical protein